MIDDETQPGGAIAPPSIACAALIALAERWLEIAFERAGRGDYARAFTFKLYATALVDVLEIDARKRGVADDPEASRSVSRRLMRIKARVRGDGCPAEPGIG